MKTKYLIFILASCCFLLNCGKDSSIKMEEAPKVPSFPFLYKFTALNFNPTKFYTYQIDRFDPIEITTGKYLLVDSLLFTDLPDETNIDDFTEPFPLKEVEIIDDALVRLKLEFEDMEHIDSNFAYYMNNDKMIVDFFNTTFKLETVEDRSQLLFCYHVFGFNFFNEQYMQRSSFWEGRDCETDTDETLLNNILDDFSDSYTFQKNDTFLINRSFFELDLIE